MAFFQKEKLFTLQWFKEYSFITIDAFILAVGYVYFIFPKAFSHSFVNLVGQKLHRNTMPP